LSIALRKPVSVIEATNPGEEISVLRARVDVRPVLTDVDMPVSVDGLKLASFVQNKVAAIKLILATGHVAVVEGELASGATVLSEALHGPEVAAAVREMISG